MRWQDWMNPLLGVWLLIAPLLMAYDSGFAGVPAINSYLVGAALIGVPLFGVAMPRTPGREWMVLGLGVWLILSPFLLGFAGEAVAAWNTGFTGAIVAVATAARIGAVGILEGLLEGLVLGQSLDKLERAFHGHRMSPFLFG